MHALKILLRDPSHAKRFDKNRGSEFEVGDGIRKANRDYVKDKDKRGRFLDKDEIKERRSDRSFIIQFENGKLQKRM